MTQGEVREKFQDWEHEAGKGNSLILNKGNFASLHTLLPYEENDNYVSNAYCNHTGVCRAIPIDVTKLRDIVKNDKAKLCKLWKLVAWRELVLQYESLEG